MNDDDFFNNTLNLNNYRKQRLLKIINHIKTFSSDDTSKWFISLLDPNIKARFNPDNLKNLIDGYLDKFYELHNLRSIYDSMPDEKVQNLIMEDVSKMVLDAVYSTSMSDEKFSKHIIKYKGSFANYMERYGESILAVLATLSISAKKLQKSDFTKKILDEDEL